MPTWTGSKTIVTYVNQGDVRRCVFYTADGDGVQSDGSLGAGISAIVTAFAAVVPHDGQILSIVSHTSAGATRAAASGFPTSNGSYSYDEATPILAYHFVCKDAANRNCGHIIHLVHRNDTDVPNIDIGVPTSALDGGGANWNTLMDAILAHCTTKSGSAYTSLIHVRLLLKRDRATGGRGRKLTVARAESYLLRHDPSLLVGH